MDFLIPIAIAAGVCIPANYFFFSLNENSRFTMKNVLLRRIVKNGAFVDFSNDPN